jgi:hypothetical protein
LARIRKVELSASTYLFYSENKSYLGEIIDIVMKSHPLGRNANFKAPQFNPKVY